MLHCIAQVGSPTKRGLTAACFLPGNNNLVVTGGLAGHVQLINIRFDDPQEMLNATQQLKLSVPASFLRLGQAQLVAPSSPWKLQRRTLWFGREQTVELYSASRWTAWQAGWPRGTGLWWLKEDQGESLASLAGHLQRLVNMGCSSSVQAVMLSCSSTSPTSWARSALSESFP